MTVGSTNSNDSPGGVADAVLEQVRRALPKDVPCDLTLDTSLYEVGLGSIERMGVLNCLEEAFELRFSEESLYEMETCRDLVQYIESSINGESPAGGSAAAAASSVPDEPAVREVLPEHYDVTQFPECVAFQQRLAMTAAAGFGNPFFRVNQRVKNATATIDGRETVSFASFNYLGMAGTPEVVAAAKEALDQFGASASASRLVGGDYTIVETLDKEIAQFFGTEAAMVLPSGHGTNESVIGHLLGPKDLILYDELAHNSITQGALLSGARRRTFPHNDVDFLDKLLADIRNRHRRVIVAVEGVYSMDGDYPNLPRLIEIKRRHQATLYVDEAHSLGVLGATGRGICEHYGVDPKDGDLWMGTISKALGSGGGFLAGPQIVIQYLKYTTPAFVFATGPSPANTAAALAALRLLQKEPERVTRLRDRSQLFLQLAKDAGLNTGGSGDTPIIPIILGDSLKCLQVSAALLEEGVDARPILYPAVPESASRVRFFINANHTEDQIRRTVKVLTDALATCKGTPRENPPSV